VSRTAIKTALAEYTPARINLGLKKAIAAGKITKEGDSFKVVLAAGNKKQAKAVPMSKIAKTKVAPKKKKAAKKKVTSKKSKKTAK
jgi:hypothetical protein